MQVLEMEEVESLVSTANRKKLRNGGGGSRNNHSTKMNNHHNNKNNNNFQSKIAAWALRNDFLPKVVVLACCIWFGMFLWSANNNNNNEDTTITSSSSVQTQTPVLIATTTTLAPTTTTVENPPPVSEVPKMVEPTNSPTSSLKEQEKEDSAETDENKQDDDDEDDKDTNPFAYSNYATILPLVDHPLPDDTTKDAMVQKYGKWHFWDGDEDNRPKEDYCGKYVHRDIPGEDFPNEAWQGDAVFVNHYLNDADQLISRTMEAIFVEYGHGKPLDPDGLAERMKMFHWSREDLSSMEKPPAKYDNKGDRGNGGWTTKRSFDGLVRRLLHAMMTQDTFTVVMGGHSAAAGEGNHFRQSYMMQFHKVVYPVFARLGVKLITRNMAQGGLGTIQAGLGSGSIYGNEVDLLLWDSGMTENNNPEHIDVFYRQALLAGNRVPVIWGGPFELLKMLHEEADVDVGQWGLATDGIMEVENAEQAEDVPWAARYMKCKAEVQDLCNNEPRFCSTCWIDREDGIQPKTKQLDKPKGQVKWHPGWRSHQLTGRNIAFAVLEALQAAVNIWNEGVMGGPPLEDEFWHVTDYYENIRNKVLNLHKDLGRCYKNEGSLPTRICTTPLKAKTQYTPRANYEETALSSIIKPAPDGYVPKNEKQPLYEGPDAHNTCFDVPEGSIDVFNVVTSRRRLTKNNPFSMLPTRADVNNNSDSYQVEQETDELSSSSAVNDRQLESITPGKGWEIWEEPQGICDGTYNNTCNLWTENECVLYGHHDYRGAIVGNEYSGWLVMTLKDVKEGIIILKVHTWHTAKESTRTEGWTSVNNQRNLRQPDRNLAETDSDQLFVEEEEEESEHRYLVRSYETPELPDSFEFEYAIDGKVTTLSKEEFLKQKMQLQRVVETLTLLDDPAFTNNKAKDLEIAIRLKGSGRAIVFGVSHVYWA